MSSDPAPSTALAELVERRAAAQRRVDELEAEQRAATEACEAARAALIQAERDDASSAQTAKLERELAAAEARASERWPERIEGSLSATPMPRCSGSSASICRSWSPTVRPKARLQPRG